MDNHVQSYWKGIFIFISGILISAAFFGFYLAPSQYFSRIQFRNFSGYNYANSRYAYYVCTQIYNESEHYLVDWLDHQFNVVGFKNVCLINVGSPLSSSLRNRYPFAYIEKKSLDQDFSYCLSACFIDSPMRSEDMLMIQDIDEYLNVRKPDEIFHRYHKYDQFHFSEIRYGYVKDTEQEMINQSLRAINTWRKPHGSLYEYDNERYRALFNCSVHGGWPACNEGNGKEMIRVGAIKALAVHFQTSNIQPERRFYVDMRKIRLNHYMMRTKEDAMRAGHKWKKIASRIGQIHTNSWFRTIFDDSILIIGSLGLTPGYTDRVWNIYASDIKMINSTPGVRIKVYPGGPTHDNCDYAFRVQTCYETQEKICQQTPSSAQMSNIINFPTCTPGAFG